MEADRFDALSRWLACRTHRRALVGGAVAASAASTLATSIPVVAARRQAATCSPATVTNHGSSGDPRYAASFVAGAAGKLSQVEIGLETFAAAEGDFIVQLFAADPTTGKPTGKARASRTVPGELPPNSKVTLVARFKKRRTTRLVQGTQYVVVVSRPGVAGNTWAVQVGTGDPCADSQFFSSPGQSSDFTERVGEDLVFTVFVGF
jgi:hypothetical protein